MIERLNRSIKLDVFVDKDKYQPILSSIRKYRAVARQMFATTALAEISGGDVDASTGTLHPSNERSKKFLELAFEKAGKAHLYEMRDLVRSDLAPEFLSFVWDSLRTTVSQRWIARDPLIKATRGWLIDQGARSLGYFRGIGIGFPQATSHPEIDGHVIRLKWSHEIGSVEFKIGKLDGGRYVHFKRLRDHLDDYQPGTFYLSERDGHIFVVITYSKPLIPKKLDEKTELHVKFTTDPDKFIIIGSENNIISAREVLGWLNEIKNASGAMQARLSACGSPRQPWGNRRAFTAVSERLNNVTQRRLHGEQVHNHLWSRRIIDQAVRDEAGIVRVFDFPEKEIFGHPWNFSQLKQFLEYKTTEIGGKIVFDLFLRPPSAA